MAVEAPAEPIFSGKALALHDFDSTTHDTREKVENGYGIEGAYEEAVKDVFGEDAFQLYKKSGGLDNRAPSSITEQLAPQLSEEQRRAKTEDLIAAKLSYLTSQIGTLLPDGVLWPRPLPGFRRSWEWLNSQHAITTGIVSSGHDEFIARAFEVHDLAPPDLTVTDDDMRVLMNILPRYLCEKPSELPVQLAAHKWLAKLGIFEQKQASPLVLVEQAKSNIVLIGDGLEMDGGMAQNAGIDFVYLPTGGSSMAYADFDHLIATKIGLRGGN